MWAEDAIVQRIKRRRYSTKSLSVVISWFVNQSTNAFHNRPANIVDLELSYHRNATNHLPKSYSVYLKDFLTIHAKRNG